MSEPREILTDFSELWKLRAHLLDEPLLPEPEPEFPAMRPIERVSHTVEVERQLGHRRWVETRTLTVIRSVKPEWQQCTSDIGFGRCEKPGSHPGLHRRPGFAWTSKY